MKILVVDDDSAMSDLLKLSLSPVYEVVTARNAVDGIEMVQQSEPDLILFDLMKIDTTSWQACKSIRKFSQVPIIILSALDNPKMVADALDAGADDYLIKPVPNRMLTAHIEKLVRRKRPIKSNNPMLGISR